jgi:hypothetical protein
MLGRLLPGKGGDDVFRQAVVVVMEVGGGCGSNDSGCVGRGHGLN